MATQIARTILGQSVKTCINALLRARVVSYDIPRSPVKQRYICSGRKNG
ncbi:hypothetical protein GVI14_02515 [Escherichia coli]|nr:hypothetical protein [Escherichia coli]